MSALSGLCYILFIRTVSGVSAPCIVELLFPHLGVGFIYVVVLPLFIILFLSFDKNITK